MASDIPILSSSKDRYIGIRQLKRIRKLIVNRDMYIQSLETSKKQKEYKDLLKLWHTQNLPEVLKYVQISNVFKCSFVIQ